jgi:hypothetical protein
MSASTRRRLDPDSAHDLVNDVIRDLTLAENLARKLTGTSDSSLGLNIARDLACAQEVARDLDSSSVRVITRARSSADTLAADLRSTVGHADGLARDYGIAVDPSVASQLIYALAHACETADDLARASASALAAARADTLARASAVASNLASPSSAERGRGGARRVVRPAAGLLAVAVRMLPATDRVRYGEEYVCELRELAQSEARLAQQMLYALRQLRSAPQIALTLRSPHRRSAAR